MNPRHDYIFHDFTVLYVGGLPPTENTEEIKKEIIPKLDKESMKLIYDLTKSEYEEESKRAHAFDPRTGVMFSLSGALTALLIINFVVPPKGTNVLFSGVIIMMEFLTLALLLIAAFFFFRVLTVKIFQRINPHKFAVGQYYLMPNEELYGVMINSYT